MSTYKPPYTPEHLARYVNYIELPSRYHPSNNPPLNIELLTALHVHQISTAPYENLSLHYSANHSIVLDPEVLYDKVVTKACNRGGYCTYA
jgi:arylamine N-acetyltransferase